MISQKGLGHNPEGAYFCGVVEVEELSSPLTSIACSLCDHGQVTQLEPQFLIYKMRKLDPVTSETLPTVNLIG